MPLLNKHVIYELSWRNHFKTMLHYFWNLVRHLITICRTVEMICWNLLLFPSNMVFLQPEKTSWVLIIGQWWTTSKLTSRSNLVFFLTQWQHQCVDKMNTSSVLRNCVTTFLNHMIRWQPYSSGKLSFFYFLNYKISICLLYSTTDTGLHIVSLLILD